MKYRAEVDGLRALAVVPVLLFHAGIPAFHGGYLGVDIFFVISGYLITAIIAGELDAGDFSIKRFYQRRARRILPALWAVLLASMLAGCFLLTGRGMRDFVQSLMAICAFVSNLLFYYEDDYFGQASELKPLLHTWSLAVEEQFYILFPLGMMLIWKFFRRALMPILVASFLLGIALSWGMAERDVNAAFFLLPARAWELLIGSLCAVWLRSPARADLPPAITWPAQLAGMLGIILIAISVLTIGEDAPLPGVKGLVPTLGAALIILFARQGTLAAKILSLPVFVWTGLISYSLYLWHYPIFVFYRYYSSLSFDAELEFNYLIPPAIAWGLIALSFVLAILSYFLIEQPFRKRRIDGRPALFGLGACYVIAGAFAVTAYKTDVQERFFLTNSLGIEAQEVDRHFTYFSGFSRLDGNPRLGNGECVFIANSLDQNILDRFGACHEKYGPGTLMIGDSHAENLHNILYRIEPEDRFQITLARAGCSLWRSECFPDEIEERVLAQDEHLFAKVYYHQIGGSLIKDGEGIADSQAAFMDPDRAVIWQERIDQGADWLARVQSTYGYETGWIGSFYEPRINFNRYQHLLKSWEPRPTILAQFTELDMAVRSSAEAAGVEYISMMNPEIVYSDRLIVGDCMMYRDLDHFSQCGEKIAAQAIVSSGHELEQIARWRAVPAP